MKHNILKEALRVLIRTKLLTEGYFYAEDCIKGVTIKQINDLLKKKNENEKLSLGNAEEDLFKIFSEINCEVNDGIAKAIVALYLNQTSPVDMKKNLFCKAEYAEIIFGKCCEYGLIDQQMYVCKKGFILEKEISLKEVVKLSDYVTIISELINNDEQELFFRGHSNINYSAKPSVFRDDFYKKNLLCFSS